MAICLVNTPPPIHSWVTSRTRADLGVGQVVAVRPLNNRFNQYRADVRFKLRLFEDLHVELLEFAPPPMRN